jgi:hypothetical protein
MTTAFEDWAQNKVGSPWAALLGSLATACGLHLALDLETEWTPVEDLGVTYDFENMTPFRAQAGDFLFTGSGTERVPFALLLDNIGTSLFMKRLGSFSTEGATVGSILATSKPGLWVVGDDSVPVTGIARFALKNPAFFGFAAPPHEEEPPTPPTPPDPPEPDRDDPPAPPKPAPPTPAPPIRRPPTPKPGPAPTPKPPITPKRAGMELGIGTLLVFGAIAWAVLGGGK